MAPWLERCLQSAVYFRRRGLLQLQAGQYLAAIESIERALLIEPEHPGTQVDYAQALIAQGDLDSATQLLRTLLARSDMPANLQPMLSAQLAQAEQQLAAQPNGGPQPVAAGASANANGLPVWAQRWTISQSFGGESNLNNAPSADQLTLTLPQGSIDLPVDEAFRPRGGMAALTGVQWTALHPDGKALWMVQADLRYRHTTDPGLRYGQLESALTWLQAPDADRQWIARLSTSQLNWAGDHLYGTLRASAQRQWAAPPDPRHWLPNAACRSGLGGEWEARRFPATPSLNGHYLGGLATWHCAFNQSAPAASAYTTHWNVQFKAGVDQPDNPDRAGHRQRQWELRNTWGGRWAGLEWQADYTWAAQIDSTGYSPLLENNAVRRIQRHTLRAELAGPAAWWGAAANGNGVPEWFVSLEASRQRSNLAAFVARQTAVFTGLRWKID